MKTWARIAFCVSLSFLCLVACVGYAALSEPLTVTGTASVKGPQYDVYITDVTPTQGEGMTVTGTYGTLLTAKVTGGGTSTFVVTVKNISQQIYVYEKTVDGAEAEIEGVYAGTDITYRVDGITPLDELAPNGGTRSFSVTVTVPEGITTDHYMLRFVFGEKFANPGGEFFPEWMPEEEVDLAQRLHDILNNQYTNENLPKPSMAYLIEDTIQVRWDQWSPPYVGSMDKNYEEQLNLLFGDVMEDTSVSFILKNQDLNGDWINEIALYSTSDTLDSTAEWGSDGVVCVYVTVFTPVIDDMWNIVGYHMVCEAVRGYCYEVRYGAEDLTPSFSTDEWKVDVGYVEGWDNVENKPILRPIPDDTLSEDGTKLYKLDYDSYNLYYQWYKTAPYGENLREWLDGRIPPLY